VAKLIVAFYGQLGFLCSFGRFKGYFGRFLGTSRFLDTVSGHRKNLYWKIHENLYFCFAV